MELMRGAFETLVENGHPPDLAFFDVCQELKVTLDLFLKKGPVELAKAISPTALYGAATRGPRVISTQARAEMQKIFGEIRSGEFAVELLGDAARTSAVLNQAKQRDVGSIWEETFERLRECL